MSDTNKEDYENQSFDNNDQEHITDNNQQLQQQQQQQQNQEMNGEEQQYQQNQQVTIQDYLVSLNHSRVGFAYNEDYNEAENVLGQISSIRSEAENRIKYALQEKHNREKSEQEELHKEEFEQFTIQWDMTNKNIQEVASIQLEQLRMKHSREIEELRMYMESSISLYFKPSPELLNLRKIQLHLSKQKNYTEAEKVQKVVKELEDKEHHKYMMKRDEKIRTQLVHMNHKHELERIALEKKIDTNIKEQDKIRKVTQQQMLQRFLNAKNELNLNQQLEVSKLKNQLKIKNYASTIVGKIEGSLKSVPPPNII